MQEFIVQGLKIQDFPNNIKIIDSYKIQDKRKIKEAINEILQKSCLYHTKRTKSSLIREWIAHNKLYEKKILIKSTKDCDLESKRSILKDFLYFIISL